LVAVLINGGKGEKRHSRKSSKDTIPPLSSSDDKKKGKKRKKATAKYSDCPRKRGRRGGEASVHCLKQYCVEKGGGRVSLALRGEKGREYLCLVANPRKKGGKSLEEKTEP